MTFIDSKCKGILERKFVDKEYIEYMEKSLEDILNASKSNKDRKIIEGFLKEISSSPNYIKDVYKIICDNYSEFDEENKILLLNIFSKIFRYADDKDYYIKFIKDLVSGENSYTIMCILSYINKNLNKDRLNATINKAYNILSEECQKY
ncbi:hypothetical protein MJ1_0393 [Nanobdella aerobiophila]|uniref:Uncharacterized protein n=1 Tax=Nanobdella aerobiophila TaxID=2586965 RepID=A0A915SKU1_9ARCH|nr:hypothetical protein [Nanobdella aerobiophila]BBL45556.1 hypothetical protein MJ1_0393 [Nanobdella aerobiophila]